MICIDPAKVSGGSFACGKCPPCRVNKQRLWASRLILESCLHRASWFVTLTYADGHLPAGGSVCPAHLRDFLKRLRERARPELLRFFGVGEYGDRTFRPHYHCVVFGLSDYSLVEKSWQFGFVHVLPLSIRLARYCCGYVTKKMTKRSDPRLQGRHPEFVRMSRMPGIGAGAGAVVAAHVVKPYGVLAYGVTGDVPKEIRFEGKKWPLGRYIRQKIRVAAGLPMGREDQRLVEPAESLSSEAWVKAFEALEAKRARVKAARASGKQRAQLRLSLRRSSL